IKKYGYKIIFSTLFSLLGLIIPILDLTNVEILFLPKNDPLFSTVIPYIIS
ncbi:CYIR protein, partial [Plasmodium cynomolgi strain B]